MRKGWTAARSRPGGIGPTSGLPLGFVLLLGAVGPAAAQIVAPPSYEVLLQRRQELLAQRQQLTEELRQERNRVTHYLTLLDEISVIRRALSQWGAEDPFQWLMATRRQLFYNSFTPQDWENLLRDHRHWATQYFAWVEGNVHSTRTWPSGRTPHEWRALALRELAIGRQYFHQQRPPAGPADTALPRANQVLAWTAGFVLVPPALNHFGGVTPRVTSAMAWSPQ